MGEGHEEEREKEKDREAWCKEKGERKKRRRGGGKEEEEEGGRKKKKEKEWKAGSGAAWPRLKTRFQRVSSPPPGLFFALLNSSWSKVSFGKVSARLAPS